MEENIDLLENISRLLNNGQYDQVEEIILSIDNGAELLNYISTLENITRYLWSVLEIKGADPETAIISILIEENFETVKRLIHIINNEYLYLLLEEAIQTGNKEIVQYLIDEMNLDIDFANYLNLAISMLNIEIVHFLLSRGARLDYWSHFNVDRLSSGSLLFLIEKFKSERNPERQKIVKNIAKLLLDYGARFDYSLINREYPEYLKSAILEHKLDRTLHVLQRKYREKYWRPRGYLGEEDLGGIGALMAEARYYLGASYKSICSRDPESLNELDLERIIEFLKVLGVDSKYFNNPVKHKKQICEIIYKELERYERTYEKEHGYYY